MARYLFLLLVLPALLCVMPELSRAAENTALTQFINQHPYLQGGGDSAETFAVWANARYLLADARSLGEVTSLGDAVAAHVYIDHRRPVLVFWTRSDERQPVTIATDAPAKLFAWGRETRSLRGRTATLAALDLPLFVRGAGERYVTEAVVNSLEWGLTTPTGANPRRQSYLLAGLPDGERPTPLEDSVGALLEAKYRESLAAHRAALTDALRAGKRKESIAALTALTDALDGALDAVLPTAVGHQDARRFTLARRLLNLRLRLCEIGAGLREYYGRGDTVTPISTMTRMALVTQFDTLLKAAEPAGRLRGYPQTAAFIRNAQADLTQSCAAPSPCAQARLIVLNQVLSRLLALEPPAVWNLVITGRLAPATGGGAALELSLVNRAQEEAACTLHLAWSTQELSDSIRLKPDGRGMLRYPIAIPAGQLVFVQLTGTLDDGTPLQPITIPIRGPAPGKAP